LLIQGIRVCEGLFVRVLELAREMGLLKMGTVGPP
jgi:hypothetical protein